MRVPMVPDPPFDSRRVALEITLHVRRMFMSIDNRDYSIIIPVFFNEGSLRDIAASIRQEVFEPMSDKEGEMVFVDDGSRDGSYEVLRELQRSHPSDIRIIKLSRNFGQVNAIWCGLEHSNSTIVTLSADGQEPVELVAQMLRKHFDEGFEVVLARRDSRDETLFRRLTSRVVYTAMKILSNEEMPVGGFDIVLLGKKAKYALLKMYQPHTYFQVRVLDLGFKRAWIGYHRCDRKHGKSRWTLARKFTTMLDGVLGHSYIPIRMMSVIGGGLSILSLGCASFFLINYLVHGHTIKGWTPIILSILFVGGVQMMMIGMLGEYLWRVLAQVRQTPPYVIEEVCEDPC